MKERTLGKQLTYFVSSDCERPPFRKSYTVFKLFEMCWVILLRPVPAEVALDA